MGANAGPDIVSDGLVLALDAADNNSFRGEPTENLVPSGQRTCSSNFTRTGYHVEVWSYALVTDVFGRADATKISITPTGNNSQPYADWGFTAHKSGGSQVGDVYTVSFDYKVTKNTTVPSLGVVYANGYKSPTSAAAASLSNETHNPLGDGWTRFSETATITTAGNTWWRFGMSSNNNETEVYVDNFQVELKSSRTRFVDGTRGTTVATGGGWTDISGNSNHGEILNGTSTSNDNTVLGALDFDGTDDYVLLGNSSQFSITNEISVLAWINAESNTGWNGIFGNTSGTGFVHFQTYNGGPNVYVYGPNAGYANLDSTTLTQGQWNQIGFTFFNSTLTLYVNGVPLDTTVTTNSNNISSTTTAGVGRVFSGDRYMNGKIAGLAVYNRGLTTQEILTNYNTQKSRFGL